VALRFGLFSPAKLDVADLERYVETVAVS